MLRHEMDAVLDRHFAAEAAHDLDGALDTLTEDVVHDVVGDPTGALHGHGEVKERYAQLFRDLTEERVTPLRRLYGADFLVDDCLIDARAVGQLCGLPGHGRPVRFRMLHVIEFRDGRISGENVWLDVASIIEQLSPTTA